MLTGFHCTFSWFPSFATISRQLVQILRPLLSSRRCKIPYTNCWGTRNEIPEVYLLWKGIDVEVSIWHTHLLFFNSYLFVPNIKWSCYITWIINNRNYMHAFLWHIFYNYMYNRLNALTGNMHTNITYFEHTSLTISSNGRFYLRKQEVYYFYGIALNKWQLLSHKE